MDEALEHGGRKNVQRDCVRLIRLFRPSVLISRSGAATSDRGQGNYQAAAMKNIEACHSPAEAHPDPEFARLSGAEVCA
jgi:hypothetical protein